jgi:RecA-family ATPase
MKRRLAAVPVPIHSVEAEPARRPMRMVDAGDLLAGAPRARVWEVPDLIPAYQPTLLGGDGGVGKSLLALQLAVAKATAASYGTRWLGREVNGDKDVVLYFGAEDDLDEVHRRLATIYSAAAIEAGDLSGRLKILPMAGEDAVLAAPSARTSALAATGRMAELEAIVEAEGPGMLILDTLADVFGGNENDRAQVRQFVGMLRGLAFRHQVTVIILGHPSAAGIASGTGTSGSTGWNNSVRSRLYLRRDLQDDGDKKLIEPDSAVRVLTAMKANYAERGTELRLRWADGVFVSDEIVPPGDFGGANRIMLAEHAFLELLRRYDQEGRPVHPAPCPTYAPTVFARDPRAQGFTRGEFVLAMNRLFATGAITSIVQGPPSKQRTRLILTSATAAGDQE